MTEHEQRERLLREAERLLGVPFPRKSAAELEGMLELVAIGPQNPKTLSCSQFVRCVVERAFGPDSWIRLVDGDFESVARVGGARTMARVLDRVDTPKAGDLQFFSNAEGQGDWHVMMVAGPNTLIGACPGEVVRRTSPSRFATMTDQRFRRVPLLAREPCF